MKFATGGAMISNPENSEQKWSPPSAEQNYFQNLSQLQH